jgi:membrane protease YdiL (CAAX protease family)
MQRSLTPVDGIAAWFARLSHWALIRLTLHIVILIAALIASKLVSNPFIPEASSPYHHGGMALANLFSAATLLVVYALAVRWIERRGAREIDPRLGLVPFAIGTAAGLGLMSLVYLVLWALGLVEFLPGTGVEGLPPALAAFFAAAVLEELVMRAVVFRLVEEIAGTVVALVISATLFGLLHALNPAATVISTGAIAIEAGVLLALAYALTRNLWLCIGLHMSWNFAEGSLFGAQVSGVPAAQTLTRTILSGSDLLTGGAFGPEASIIAMGLFVVASAIVARMVFRRSRWQPLRLRLRLA